MRKMVLSAAILTVCLAAPAYAGKRGPGHGAPMPAAGAGVIPLVALTALFMMRRRRTA